LQHVWREIAWNKKARWRSEYSWDDIDEEDLIRSLPIKDNYPKWLKEKIIEYRW